MKPVFFSRSSGLVTWLFASLTLLALAATSHAAEPEAVRAHIVRIDAPRSNVILKHEPIKSIAMDAMTMPFKVKNPAMLAPLRVGDRVNFSIVIEDDEPVVSDIKLARGKQ